MVEAMKHDLEAVNASLRLGDAFFLPEHAICILRWVNSWVRERHLETLEVVVRRYHYNGDHLFLTGLSRRSKREWEFHLGDLAGWEISEVLNVPPRAPPFSEWDRP